MQIDGSIVILWRNITFLIQTLIPVMKGLNQTMRTRRKYDFPIYVPYPHTLLHIYIHNISVRKRFSRYSPPSCRVKVRSKWIQSYLITGTYVCISRYGSACTTIPGREPDWVISVMAVEFAGGGFRVLSDRKQDR